MGAFYFLGLLASKYLLGVVMGPFGTDNTTGFLVLQTTTWNL